MEEGEGGGYQEAGEKIEGGEGEYSAKGGG